MLSLDGFSSSFTVGNNDSGCNEVSAIKKSFTLLPSPTWHFPIVTLQKCKEPIKQCKRKYCSFRFPKKLRHQILVSQPRVLKYGKPMGWGREGTNLPEGKRNSLKKHEKQHNKHHPGAAPTAQDHEHPLTWSSKCLKHCSKAYIIHRPLPNLTILLAKVLGGTSYPKEPVSPQPPKEGTVSQVTFTRKTGPIIHL